MGPRWKGKDSKSKALAEPLSKIVSALQLCLRKPDAKALLSGCSVLLEADAEQSELLNRACFGRLVDTSQKDKLWYKLGLEEAFYLCYSLKCLKIVGTYGVVLTDNEIWNYMERKVEMFAELYKGYAHLRMKNWVVRPGSQYGVDYVAYRHHPSLVHSEYAVLVLSNGNGKTNGRLSWWSDMYCTIRLSGGVAKTLLVLHVQGNRSVSDSPECLDNYEIEECTIRRWIPEQSRENKSGVKCDSKTEAQI